MSMLRNLVVLIAGLAAACSKQAPPTPPPPAVTVTTVSERDVQEWDEFQGRIEATDNVEIRPRVSGYVEEVRFAEGKEVKKGDVLYIIDQRQYRAELERAEAELLKARTQVELWRSDVERAHNLLAARAISQEEYDTRIAAQRGGDAAVESAQATLDLAKLNLTFTEVTSPIDGRAGQALVRPGNLVTSGASGSGATLLTTVVAIDPVYVYFEGDENVYLKYGLLAREGTRPSSRDTRNPIRMGLANEDGYPHLGYMDFVDNQLNPQTGTIRGRAVFDNKDRLFTPGLFARLQLVGSGTYRATLMPDQAIGTDQDRKFALVVTADNHVEYRGITLGPMIDGLRVVKDGLKDGDKVVVTGLQRVRPGIVVAPTEVELAAAAAGPGSSK
jgi:multidrug efflux system membrane fusion protein